MRARSNKSVWVIALCLSTVLGAAGSGRAAEIESPEDFFPASVHTVMGLDGDGAYQTRLKALYALGRDLDSAESGALITLLGHRAYYAGLRPAKERVFVNEILKQLRLQDQPPSGLGAAMIALYRDRSRDEAVRDYALQHAMEWYPHASDQAAIAQTLLAALDERGGTIAGTAILALSRLSKSHDELDAVRVEKAALEIASDEGRGTTARIAALQACAILGAVDILPTARHLIQNADSDHLKISAIAAIGQLGGPGDRDLLLTFTNHSTTRFRPAAQSALARLESK